MHLEKGFDWNEMDFDIQMIFVKIEGAFNSLNIFFFQMDVILL